MSDAEDMVERVLRWAAAPAGPPPVGEPFGLSALLSPRSAVRQVLSALAAVTAARFGLADSALTGGAGPGSAAAWLAAALGLRSQPGLAMDVLSHVPPACASLPDGGWELIARHGVVAAALPYLPGGLAEAMIAASPLTALLLAPARGGDDRVLAFCQNLIAAIPGCPPVVAAFADPYAGTAKLTWRASALGRLAISGEDRDRSFTLDVYETAVVWHGRDWLTRTLESAEILGAGDSLPEQIGEAMAVGRWWQPLGSLRHRRPDAIRDRHYLDFHVYWRGLRLAAVTARLDGMKG